VLANNDALEDGIDPVVVVSAHATSFFPPRSKVLITMALMRGSTDSMRAIALSDTCAAAGQIGVEGHVAAQGGGIDAHRFVTLGCSPPEAAVIGRWDLLAERSIGNHATGLRDVPARGYAGVHFAAPPLVRRGCCR